MSHLQRIRCQSFSTRCSCQQGAPVESRPGTKNLLGQRWMPRSPPPTTESPTPSPPLPAAPTSWEYSCCWACLQETCCATVRSGADTQVWVRTADKAQEQLRPLMPQAAGTASVAHTRCCPWAGLEHVSNRTQTQPPSYTDRQHEHNRRAAPAAPFARQSGVVYIANIAHCMYPDHTLTVP